MHTYVSKQTYKGAKEACIRAHETWDANLILVCGRAAWYSYVGSLGNACAAAHHQAHILKTPKTAGTRAPVI